VLQPQPRHGPAFSNIASQNFVIIRSHKRSLPLADGKKKTEMKAKQRKRSTELIASTLEKVTCPGDRQPPLVGFSGTNVAFVAVAVAAAEAVALAVAVAVAVAKVAPVIPPWVSEP
jgi:hypothetical protein